MERLTETQLGLIFIVVCFLCFLFGVVMISIAVIINRRDDVMIVDDFVDRERVRRFLSLPESSRRRIDGEVSAEIESYPDD